MPRKKPDARGVDLLIDVLRDPTARIDERDDAAIDLGLSDDPVALSVLLEVARNSAEDEMVLGSVGESLAEIAVRTASFEPSWLEGMAEPAAAELRGALRLRGPESMP